MCGISLIVDYQRQLNSESPIRQMTSALHHRGPDAQAVCRIESDDKQLFIANNRLKIIDLSEQGNQPMQCSEQGKAGTRFTLSYNGELYNHFELKNELLRMGYSFRSNTDTEVLLYALVAWGEEALPRLQGMFAFIFYDQQANLLLLARDRHSMKPLYYHSSDAYLIASSELRGIFASGLVKKELNEPQVYHYLQFRYAQKPQTFYKAVFELLPGYCLIAKAGEKPDLKAFPSPAKPVFEPSSPDKLLSQLEERLTDALFSHLHTDRGVGLFLSGGVDSTLMLALLRKHSTYQLPLCFTISHKPEEKSWGTEDAYWADKAARQYDATPVPVEISVGLLEQFPAFIAEQDQPIGDSAAWLTSLLSKEAAARQVRVVLSGAGADEFFGGYNRHRAFYFYLKHFRQLQWFLPAFKTAGNLLPAGSLLLGRKQLRLIKRLLKDVDPSPAQTFQNFISFSAPNQKSAGIIPDENTLFEEGWMQAALQHDRQHYLSSDILALNDKAAMQHSLEMRMPYLSEEVAGLAEALPASYIMGKGRKWILNQLLETNGGAAYVRRKKEGFGLPFGLWIREGKTDFLWKWLNQKNHLLHQFIEPAYTRKLLEAHKSGRYDSSMELFSLAVLAHWLQKEFA